MFSNERQNIDSGFDKMYNHTIKTADKVGTIHI